MATPGQDVIHAYRRLYRSVLRAVQHARPARFVVRDQLRSAFREPGAQLDGQAVKRTVWFLEAAAKERGLEHKVLKNLVDVRLRRQASMPGWKRIVAQQKQRNPWGDYEKSAFEQYDMTVAMLNKTMGLCLRHDRAPPRTLPIERLVEIHTQLLENELVERRTVT
ncbi:Pfam:DUF1763 [Geosmithia morbida]|uniref:Pfam:DUF1763 n=1 Tax=Geosmithia morbida TaxID=1094350 RepID=A0A9P4Z091_9HYPO|nr:Pfam:DUF1763 [Geosmithia morbida]KAF4126321.1 Pfam:DUF1763 [Geosmithia morbida]